MTITRGGLILSELVIRTKVFKDSLPEEAGSCDLINLLIEFIGRHAGNLTKFEA